MEFIMKFLILIVLIFAGCSTLPPSRPSPNLATLCDKQDFEQPDHRVFHLNYCIHKYDKSTDMRTLWLLHGTGDSERAWVESQFEGWNELTTAIRQKFGDNPPTVVTIDIPGTFMHSWLVTNETTRYSQPPEATVKTITEIFIPFLEEKFGLKGPRLLYGTSMGGMNVLQICFNRPDMFNKCAATSAESPLCEPYDMFDTRCWMNKPGGVLLQIRANYTSPQMWEKENPINQAKVIDLTKLPAIYLSDGIADEFGFYPGNEKLAGILKLRSANIIWNPTDKDHTHLDADKLYEFLK